MRHEKGKIWLSRRLARRNRQINDFYGDGHMLAIWTLLLLNANWKDGTTIPKGCDGVIQRGKVLTSLPEISAQTGFSTQTVRRCLNFLKKTGRISWLPNRLGRVITIIKFDTWQFNPESPTGYPTGSQQEANRKPTGSRTHSEEEKNGIREEEKKTTSRKKTIPITDWDKSISCLLAEAIRSNNPKSINLSEAKVIGWADTFRKMREVDKINKTDIEKALDFTFRDDFWSGVVQSATGFRRNWNKITAKMRRNGGSLHDKARRIDELFDSGAVESFF